MAAAAIAAAALRGVCRHPILPQTPSPRNPAAAGFRSVMVMCPPPVHDDARIRHQQERMGNFEVGLEWATVPWAAAQALARAAAGAPAHSAEGSPPLRLQRPQGWAGLGRAGREGWWAPSWASCSGQPLPISSPPPARPQVTPAPDRTLANTGLYAAACKQVAAAKNLPCLDLYSRLQVGAGRGGAGRGGAGRGGAGRGGAGRGGAGRGGHACWRRRVCLCFLGGEGGLRGAGPLHGHATRPAQRPAPSRRLQAIGWWDQGPRPRRLPATTAPRPDPHSTDTAAAAAAAGGQGLAVGLPAARRPAPHPRRQPGRV
jgi:hypothetical protein